MIYVDRKYVKDSYYYMYWYISYKPFKADYVSSNQ